jgi:hypothetical protein
LGRDAYHTPPTRASKKEHRPADVRTSKIRKEVIMAAKIKKSSSAKKTTKAAASVMPTTTVVKPVVPVAPVLKPAAPASPVMKPTTPVASTSQSVSAVERAKMIEVAAYLIAEKNGFRGDARAYWLQAEKDVDTKLGKK